MNCSHTKSTKKSAEKTCPENDGTRNIKFHRRFIQRVRTTEGTQGPLRALVWMGGWELPFSG